MEWPTLYTALTIKFQYGEFSYNHIVRKEMRVTGDWSTKPNTVTIFVTEYQLHKIQTQANIFCLKRRMLCQQEWFFFLDPDEAFLQKCQVSIKDNSGKLFFLKNYSQVDRVNHRFYTLQLIFIS